MIARVTTFVAIPDKIPDLVAGLDGIRSKISGVSGLVTSYTVWAEDGQGMTFTVYEDAASAEAAQSTVRNVWDGIAGYLAAGPDVREFSTVEKIAG